MSYLFDLLQIPIQWNTKKDNFHTYPTICVFLPLYNSHLKYSLPTTSHYTTLKTSLLSIFHCKGLKFQYVFRILAFSNNTLLHGPRKSRKCSYFSKGMKAYSISSPFIWAYKCHTFLRILVPFRVTSHFSHTP